MKGVIMTLREISALVSTILVIVGTIWYIFWAVKGTKIKPVMATWIVLAGTMTLSFATYWTTPHHSIVSNACNAISVLSTGAILVTALLLSFKEGKKIVFSSFQKGCLWISGAIAIFWIVLVWGCNGTGIIPNILTQVLMLIGYAVTAEKLWYAEKNSESLFTWWCILFAGVVALYTGIVSHDKLVILYAGRTTFGTVILVTLMYRIENRVQRKAELWG